MVAVTELMTQTSLIRSPFSGLYILNRKKKSFFTLRLLNCNNKNLKFTVAILSPPPIPYRVKEQSCGNRILFVSLNPSCSELHELISPQFVSVGLLHLLNNEEKKDKEEILIPITDACNFLGNSDILMTFHNSFLPNIQ